MEILKGLEKKMLNVEFEEKIVTENEDTIVLYFTAPKEYLNGKYPEAVSCTICIELPADTPTAENANVLFSPTKPEGEEGLTDYDWYNVNLPVEEINELISLGELGKKAQKKRKEKCEQDQCED